MTIKTTTPNAASGRIIRTVFQVLAAGSAAVPMLVKILGISAATSAEVTGIVGLLIIVITSLHNGLETAGILPAMFKSVELPVLTPTLSAAANTLSPTIVKDANAFANAGAVVAPVIQAAVAPATTPVVNQVVTPVATTSATTTPVA